jgi:hypothetical protein
MVGWQNRLFSVTFMAIAIASTPKYVDAASKLNDNWEASACAADLKTFTRDMPSQIRRLRVPKQPVNAFLQVEFGSPNLPSVKEGEPFQLLTQGIVEFSEYQLGINNGGWIAIRFHGGTDPSDVIETQTFYDYRGSCHQPESGGHFKTVEELPRSLQLVFKPYLNGKLAADNASNVAQVATPTIVADAPKTKPNLPENGLNKGWSTPVNPGRISFPPVCTPKGVWHDYYPIDLFSTQGPDGGPIFYVGKSEFMQALNEMPIEVRRQWGDGVAGNAAWAIYDRDHDKPSDPFTVQYVYRYNKNCAYYPDKPVRVDIQSLPYEAAGHYLFQANLDTGGTIQDMRERLAVGLKSAKPDARVVSESDSNFDQASDTVTKNSSAGSRNFGEFPQPFRSKLKELDKECGLTAGRSLHIQDGFLISADIDGDGDVDWIGNGDHIYCTDSAGNGGLIGGGNEVVQVWIALNTPKGPVGLDTLWVSQGSIKQFQGFAVVENNGLGTPNIQISKSGKITPIQRVPKGGKLILTISR